MRLGVDHLDRVVVADRDQHVSLIACVNSMPRGRWPTLMVRVTSHLSVSITDTVLLFSFET
jgi:Trk K+ transport system NAD-binding subunit